MELTTNNTSEQIRPSGPTAPQTPKPELKTSEQGTYKGLFLAPIGHLERIKAELTKMAETDVELANAIAEGKKTFEGCDRYIRNNMSDLAGEMGKREITFDDATVHLIARYYMVNPDNLDVQNVAKAVTPKPSTPITATPSKPKAEPKKVKMKVEDCMEDLFDL